MIKSYKKVCAMTACCFVWLLAFCLVATVAIILLHINVALALITAVLLLESTVKKAIQFNKWFWPKKAVAE